MSSDPADQTTPDPRSSRPQGDDQDWYGEFADEDERLRAVFADPDLARRAAERRAVTPIRSRSANGSFGRALALGFANVFDPDRVRDDIVAVQERGDGDGDAPETDLDPDDPRTTRVVYRRSTPAHEQPGDPSRV